MSRRRAKREISPAVLDSYPPGTIALVKMKGYPWWPARVECDDTVPLKVLLAKQRLKGPLLTVLFLGSREYGFAGPDTIRQFDRAFAEQRMAKSRNTWFALAMRQALDPSLLEEAMKENEDSDSGNVHEKKKRKLGLCDDVKRKQNKQDEEENTAKDQKKEEHMKQQKPTSNSGKDETNVKRFDTVNATTKEYNNHLLEMYILRHKLQKLVHKKKPGEIPRQDYPCIQELLDNIEKIPVTLELIKRTKIARVLKLVMLYEYEDDDATPEFKRHCLRIMRKWRIAICGPDFAHRTTARHTVTRKPIVINNLDDSAADSLSTDADTP